MTPETIKHGKPEITKEEGKLRQKLTRMRSPENELAGYSSGLIKLAKERQKSGPFKGLVKQYEEGERNNSSLEEWLQANPRGYYEIGGEKTVIKGVQFAEGVLPINAKETNLPFVKKIKLELRLLKEKLFG